MGPTGTGKSVYVKDKLMNHLEKDKYFPFYVNFSARTSANQVQVSLKPETWLYSYYFLIYLVSVQNCVLNEQLCKSSFMNLNKTSKLLLLTLQVSFKSQVFRTNVWENIFALVLDCWALSPFFKPKKKQ